VTPGVRIAYLHGFNSSPASIKSQQLARAIDGLPPDERPEYFVPHLSHHPSEAMRNVMVWADRAETASLTFVGSSLGGFYATWLAERYGARAVLINPAIHPAIDLTPYLGRQTNLYTREEYELGRDDLAQLERLRVEKISRPERYLLLVQTGDEVLDYRVAIRIYAGAWQGVQGGGDHGFRDFGAQIPVVLRFAGVGSATAARFRYDDIAR
jgi:predicted esterase YcpF (UPF0227 family)